MPETCTVLNQLQTDTSAGLRRAGAWRTLGDLLWPVQAAAVAGCVGGWVTGATLQASVLLAVVFALAGLARALLEHRGLTLASRCAETAVADLRARLLSDTLHQSTRPLSSAAFSVLLVQKLPALTAWAARYRPARIRVMVVPLALLILSLCVSWAVALVLLITGPLIPVFMALVGIAARDASARQMAEIGTLNSLLSDRLAALSDIRLLDAGDRVAADFTDRADILRARTMEVLRIAFLSSTVLELFSAIGVAMVAVFVGFSLLGELRFGAWASPLTLSEGLFLLLLAPTFYQPLRDLAAAWHDKAAAEAVAAEIDQMRAAETVDILGTGGPAAASDAAARITTHAVHLSHGARVPDFSALPGQMLTLSGPSGAGKTTLLRALAGLVPLASGHIDVAGRPLDDKTADGWRARMAWLPQQIHFPDQSLADFLCPGAPSDRLREALDRAAADGIVDRLPGGLSARLGETGAGLSGGEARRMLLARALLAAPEVVLADEPTADLDAATAERVIAALRDLARGGATVIVASHDPALIAAADAMVSL